MFYIVVSKFFAFLLMPAGIVSFLLIYAISTKNRTKSKKIVISAFIFFYVFTNPFLVNELMVWWEVAPTPISTVKPHDIGIILTGGATKEGKLPKENIFLGAASDRIGQTIILYKCKKIHKILISGGNIEIFGPSKKKEIEEIAKFLILSGIPSDSIFLEAHSINTRENAVNCSKILKKNFPHQSIILITSGYHLRRATQCFEKVGIRVTPYGANYNSYERNFLPINLFPNEACFGYTQLLFREVIGYWVYKLLGWL